MNTINLKPFIITNIKDKYHSQVLDLTSSEVLCTVYINTSAKFSAPCNMGAKANTLTLLQVLSEVSNEQ